MGPENAEVVELVDTLCSGRSVRKDVGVQVPPSAENEKALGPFDPRAFICGQFRTTEIHLWTKAHG